MGSYLGLPKNLGGSKIQVFSFVQERLNIIINGLTFKFFTQGGKEVVIKSMVTALLNHVMSCYRLPKATAKKLTSAVAQLWWSPGGAQKVCTRNCGTKYVQIRMKEVWVLKILRILIRRCLVSSNGV